jgi:hypothetical protein
MSLIYFSFRCFVGGTKSSLSSSWGGSEVLATHFLFFEPVQMYRHHEKAQSVMLSWGLEEVDLDADLVHLEQLAQGLQEDQVSMTLD